MNKHILFLIWIFIKLTAGQMDEVTEVPPDHDLGDACVSNVQSTVDTSITVQWNSPTQECWANSYRVRVTATNLGQCNMAGDSVLGEWFDADDSGTNEVLLSNLPPYTSYTIEVIPGTTDTSNGDTVPGTSVSVQETTNAEGPESVTSLAVTTQTDATQLGVTWEYNPSSQQCDLFVVQYVLIQRDQCPDLPQGTRTLFSNMDIAKSVTLTGLVPYSTYIVIVEAMNDVGTSNDVNATGITANAAPSAAPANAQTDTASSTDVGLTFTWAEVPCGSRGGPITGYRYSFTQQAGTFDDTNTFDTGNTDLSVTVTQLTCNTEYMFRVAAINSVGLGPYSETITARSTYSATEAFADGTQATVSDITATTAQISWQVGGCTSPDTTYSISYQLTNREQCEDLGTTGPTSSLIPVTGGQTTATVGNLVAYSSYIVTVTGTVPGGSTRTVTNTFQTSQGVPQVSPTGVQAGTITTTSISFSWNGIACGDRSGVITYRYSVTQNGQFVRGSDTQSTSANVVGLSPSTTYFITVTSLTAFEVTGPSSTAISATTEAESEDNTITNPDGETCTTCTTNEVVSASIAVESINGETATFTEDLNDPTSQAYVELATTMSAALQPSCDALPDCSGIVINGFASGSIIVNYDYLLSAGSTTTTAQVENAINNVANDQSGTLDINTARTTLTDYCPPNYCSNGGTCVSDTSQQRGFCLCQNGYGGTTCTDIVPTSSSGGGDNGGSGGGGTGNGQDDKDHGVLAISVSSVALALLLIVSVSALSIIIYARIVRPRMDSRRQMQFARPHPEAMLARDHLLVDPVSLTSPWSYRQSTYDGNAYFGPSFL